MSKNIELDCALQRIVSKEGRMVTAKAMKDDSDAPFVIIGPLGDVCQGMVLRLTGRWRKDDGRWVFVASKARRPVAGKDGALEWLSSGVVTGIGPGLAERIVRKFGTRTLDVLEDCPRRLLEVQGIGRARLEMILEGLRKAPRGDQRNAGMELAAYGIQGETARKLIARYKGEVMAALRRNPYILTAEIYGIGFRKADTIAECFGIEPSHPLRIASGIRYALGLMANLGHLFADRDALLRESQKVLGLSLSQMAPVMEEMVRQRILVEEDGVIYRRDHYRMECDVARALAWRSSWKVDDLWDKRTMRKITGGVRAFLTGKARKYDAEQMDAIRTALTRNITLLTGGPGTGKTLTVEGMIKGFTAHGWKVALAAPTGRAAKRMEECCGMRAKTLHRLLGLGTPKEGWGSNADVLIIDECSMIDMEMMDNILSMVPPEVRLVFVGDTDQLPSVGPGNVLRDMLLSGVLPTVKLEKVHRQSPKSFIVPNAHCVNHGIMPDLNNDPDGDFFFLPCEDPAAAASLIAELVKTRLPSAYHLDCSDIQVLSPMKKGDAGTVALNTSLQAALNPPTRAKDELRFGDTVFRVGDKVMQTRNNYDLEVFNGDIGQITEAWPDVYGLRVRFPGSEGGKSVSYTRLELDQLIPAYACTVHKSQGSEFPAVILPVLDQHHIMLQRNLIYTAITRAQKLCVLVGSPSALSYAISNDVAPRRNSRLRDRLVEQTARFAAYEKL